MKTVLFKILIFYIFTVTNTFGDSEKPNCRSYAEWDNIRHCLLEIDREYPILIENKPNNSQIRTEDLFPNEIITLQSDSDGPPQGLITEDTNEE
jgi:hypothetical protein